ncbi:hypothetical protein SLOPH_581 [Spraguea lophii 42_110]|uniref:Uncharacterized protein n=1 Tax=Spraguea lophii (strain 42_110) TaxID=1358809 RepID=S7W571_SPRLO|nr:hypothetical protein SLOPH_581 [Spraguea lophii 42_110]
MDDELLKDLEYSSTENIYQKDIKNEEFRSRNDENKEKRKRKIELERKKNLINPQIQISKDYILNPTDRCKSEAAKEIIKVLETNTEPINYGLVAIIDIEVEVKKGLVILYDDLPNDVELLITEGKKRDIRRMEKSLRKLKQNILWVGEAPKTFNEFNIIKYSKEVENNNMFYKSLINEIVNK